MFNSNIDTRNKKLNKNFEKTTTIYFPNENMEVFGENRYKNRQFFRHQYEQIEQTTNGQIDHGVRSLGEIGYGNTDLKYRMFRADLAYCDPFAYTSKNSMMVSRKLVDGMIVETCRKTFKKSNSRGINLKRYCKSEKSNKNQSTEDD